MPKERGKENPGGWEMWGGGRGDEGRPLKRAEQPRRCPQPLFVGLSKAQAPSSASAAFGRGPRTDFWAGFGVFGAWVGSSPFSRERLESGKLRRGRPIFYLGLKAAEHRAGFPLRAVKKE